MMEWERQDVEIYIDVGQFLDAVWLIELPLKGPGFCIIT